MLTPEHAPPSQLFTQHQSQQVWPFINSHDGCGTCRWIKTQSSTCSLAKSPFHQRSQPKENFINQAFSSAVGYLIWLGIICFAVTLIGGGGWAPIMGFVAAAPIVLIVAGLLDGLG